MEELSIPSFESNDDKIYTEAYQSMNYIFKYPFSCEFEIIKGIFVYLIYIFRHFLTIPLKLISYKNKNSFEFLNLFSILMSVIISYGFVLATGFTLETSLNIIKNQKLYKIWAIYTIFLIVGKFLTKTNRQTHLLIRGAIKSNNSIFLPIILHSLSNFLNYSYLNIIISTHLAGFGGKNGLFLSACLHIQAVFLKKFLPKAAESTAFNNEIQNRLLVIFSLIFFSTYENIFNGILILIFEYGSAFLRFFLVSLTSDSIKFIDFLKFESKEYLLQVKGSPSNINNSLFFNIPHESFALILISLIIESGIIHQLIIIILIIVFYFISKLIFNPQIKSKIEKEKEINKPKKE